MMHSGMLGTLSWQGVTMDPIMMAGTALRIMMHASVLTRFLTHVLSALIISIGFSIDIPAHVSYHYHSAGTFE